MQGEGGWRGLEFWQGRLLINKDKVDECRGIERRRRRRWDGDNRILGSFVAPLYMSGIGVS